MKIILIIATLTLTSLIALNQESNIKKHEFGINLFSSNSMYSSISYQYDSYFRYAIQTSFLNGLSYKYHMNSSAIRFGIQYQYEKLPTENPQDGYVTGELYYGEIYNIDAKLGYQRSFGEKKFKPYVFADLFFGYGYTDALDGGWMGPTIEPITYEVKNFSYGVSPGLGVTYQIIPMLSLRIETNINTGYYYQTGRRKYWSNQSNFEKFSEGSFITFNPVGTASINFHF